MRYAYRRWEGESVCVVERGNKGGRTWPLSENATLACRRLTTAHRKLAAPSLSERQSSPAASDADRLPTCTADVVARRKFSLWAATSPFFSTCSVIPGHGG